MRPLRVLSLICLSHLWGKSTYLNKTVKPQKVFFFFLNDSFYFPPLFQRQAARSKRIQTPICVNSPRERRMTLIGCCIGRTVHLLRAPTSCGVSVPLSYVSVLLFCRNLTLKHNTCQQLVCAFASFKIDLKINWLLFVPVWLTYQPLCPVSIMHQL